MEHSWLGHHKPGCLPEVGAPMHTKRHWAQSCQVPGAELQASEMPGRVAETAVQPQDRTQRKMEVFYSASRLCTLSQLGFG